MSNEKPTPPATPVQPTASVEAVAAIIDPDVWKSALPIPTRADTVDFHRRRQQSCAIAERIVASLTPAQTQGDGA